MEILAAILYFSNFAFSAAAVILSVVLYRHYRHCGWLMLAVAFASPFGFLLLRLIYGRPLLTYISYGSDVNGLAHVTIRYDIPGFYMVVVVALILLIRDAKRSK